MAKLTDEQKQDAKAFMHDLTIWGGIVDRSKSKRDKNYWYTFAMNHYNGNAGATAAKEVCTELKTRAFANLDNALNTLSEYKFQRIDTVYYGKSMRKKPDMLARYIAWFCKNLGIYWDDSNKTAYELEEFKNTLLGKALYENACFVSQINGKNSNTTNTAQNTAGTQAQTVQAAPRGTKGYKVSGGHGNEIPNLFKQTKIDLRAMFNYLYCIEADKVQTNVPCAYITPIKWDVGQDKVVLLQRDEAEKVKFASGNGYTDCKLWFTDIIVADAFVQKCINKFGSKFTNVHVAKARPDKGTYYEVTTEFGNAYIKASKLNEELEEAMKTNNFVENANEELDNGRIRDIDVYQEAMFKYD